MKQCCDCTFGVARQVPTRSKWIKDQWLCRIADFSPCAIERAHDGACRPHGQRFIAYGTNPAASDLSHELSEREGPAPPHLGFSRRRR